MGENVVAYLTIDFSQLPSVNFRFNFPPSYESSIDFSGLGFRFNFRGQQRARRARSPEPSAKIGIERRG